MTQLGNKAVKTTIKSYGLVLHCKVNSYKINSRVSNELIFMVAIEYGYCFQCKYNKCKIRTTCMD